jgi:hypothetical protein
MFCGYEVREPYYTACQKITMVPLVDVPVRINSETEHVTKSSTILRSHWYTRSNVFNGTKARHYVSQRAVNVMSIDCTQCSAYS